jgi:uncharacterized membrane protein YbaN (DUF454 family)
MDEQQARLILQAYRPGDQDQNDPQFAEALEEMRKNPELARWFAEEREFDLAVAAHLESVAAPYGLKTRILAQARPPATSATSRWAAGLAVVAALLFLFAQIVSLWRESSHPSTALPDYTREMVSFVRLTPPLELESKDLGAIKQWLAQKEMPALEVPARLAALDPVGCRVLSFRGRDVTLICFQRDKKRLAHLFVVDRSALPKLKPGAAPIFSREGDWTTASWAEKDRAYTIAVQGGPDAARRYLPGA